MNPNLIKGKIAEAGLTQGETAKKAGMSSNSLCRKLSGKRQFKLSEVYSICNVLSITDPAPYFFDQNSPNAQRNNSGSSA